jgi:hypothetical protein
MVVSFIGGGHRSTRRKPPNFPKSLTNFIARFSVEFTSPWAGLEITTLLVKHFNCINSCNFNYHEIMKTMYFVCYAMCIHFVLGTLGFCLSLSRTSQLLLFCFMGNVLYIVVCPFFLFRLAIALSVRRLTVSDDFFWCSSIHLSSLSI